MRRFGSGAKHYRWVRWGALRGRAVPRMGRASPPAHLAPALLLALAGLAAPPAAQSQGLVVRDGTLGSPPAGVLLPGPDDLGDGRRSSAT